MDQAAAPLKKTPLNARHRASGAKMIPFGGWDMPLEYTGIAPEHLAVRTSAGLFDVSHMGELEIAGTDALAAVQRISCNDASVLQPGQAQYSGLLTQQGTFVDDLIVYRLKSDHFLLVVNAANIVKDYTWIAEQIAAAGDAVVVDASSRYALLAVQGPKALAAVQPLTGVDLASISHYSFAHGEVASVRATVSRTGYTGEDGFEIFVPPQSADRVWQAILASGQADGLIPCGLGARDTLRLEAALRLYGNEIDDTTTALEAGLRWIVGWTKDDFLGAAALRAQQASGVSRKLAGFELLDQGIARPGHDVYAAGAQGGPSGKVTSGTQTPFLKKSIGMAYVPVEQAKPDAELEIDIRGRRARARVVPLPFYKRA
jgi:aminomethyltransferase